MEYFAPPLTDQDFNKQVGRYSQSIFQRNSSRALTATSIGNLVVWDNNKPVTKGRLLHQFLHNYCPFRMSISQEVWFLFIARTYSGDIQDLSYMKYTFC